MTSSQGSRPGLQVQSPVLVRVCAGDNLCVSFTSTTGWPSVLAARLAQCHADVRVPVPSDVSPRSRAPRCRLPPRQARTRSVPLCKRWHMAGKDPSTLLLAGSPHAPTETNFPSAPATDGRWEMEAFKGTMWACGHMLGAQVGGRKEDTRVKVQRQGARQEQVRAPESSGSLAGGMGLAI